MSASRSLLTDDGGSQVVEYALLTSLISIGIVVALLGLQPPLCTVVADVSALLTLGTPAACSAGGGLGGDGRQGGGGGSGGIGGGSGGGGSGTGGGGGGGGPGGGSGGGGRK